MLLLLLPVARSALIASGTGDKTLRNQWMHSRAKVAWVTVSEESPAGSVSESRLHCSFRQVAKRIHSLSL